MGNSSRWPHDAHDDLLKPLGDCRTPEVAEKVIQLRAADERIGLLAGKSAAGTLSHDEREDDEAFLLLVQTER